MRKNIIFAAIVLLLLIGLGVASWQVYLPIQEDSESFQSYEDLRQYAHKRKVTLTVQLDGEPSSEQELTSVPELPEEDSSEPAQPEMDFEALKAINPEIVGWLTIDGTNIDYPIVQHADNDYYLHHLFTGAWNSSGCLFTDCRNESDFSDRHSIIYGHHMDNGTMFQNLMYYKNQDFYNQHPMGKLVTPSGSYTIEFFAGYVANVDNDTWTIDFTSDEEFAQWLSKSKERSLFASSVTPSERDRVVTLSTCSYEFYNARFVLLGKFAPD